MTGSTRIACFTFFGNTALAGFLGLNDSHLESAARVLPDELFETPKRGVRTFVLELLKGFRVRVLAAGALHPGSSQDVRRRPFRIKDGLQRIVPRVHHAVVAHEPELSVLPQQSVEQTHRVRLHEPLTKILSMHGLPSHESVAVS